MQGAAGGGGKGVTGVATFAYPLLEGHYKHIRRVIGWGFYCMCDHVGISRSYAVSPIPNTRDMMRWLPRKILIT